MADWKKTIEENPLIILLTACVAVAGVAVATVAWFWNQSSALKEREFETRISTVTTAFESKVNNLKQRLVSIERRVSGKTLYLDVSAIPVPSEKLPSLAQSHKPYNDGYYYVSPPSFDSWMEKRASQLDLIEPLFGSKFSEQFGSLTNGMFDALSAKTGMLWVSNSSVKAILPEESDFRRFAEIESLEMKPFIFAIPIDEDLMKRTAQTISTIITEIEKPGESLSRLIKLLSDEDNESNEGSTKENASSNGKDELDDSDPENILVELNNLSRGDLAGFILMDALVSNTQFARTFGGTVNVASADKKGNVLYLRLHTRIPTNSFGQEHDSSFVILDQEYFFIGTQRGGILVRAAVPSLAFKTDAYAWTQGWLNSLRVPIN